MHSTRNGDSAPRNWFRTDRFFQSEGEWYFMTREGSVEGPFESRRDAANRLATYLAIFGDLTFHADASPEMDLAHPATLPFARAILEPLHMRWR